MFLVKHTQSDMRLHSKNAVSTQRWVKYGQSQPIVYFFFNYVFNPTFRFVHIWSKIGLKQPSVS